MASLAYSSFFNESNENKKYLVEILENFPTTKAYFEHWGTELKDYLAARTAKPY